MATRSVVYSPQCYSCQHETCDHKVYTEVFKNNKALNCPNNRSCYPTLRPSVRVELSEQNTFALCFVCFAGQLFDFAHRTIKNHPSSLRSMKQNFEVETIQAFLKNQQGNFFRKALEQPTLMEAFRTWFKVFRSWIVLNETGEKYDFVKPASSEITLAESTDATHLSILTAVKKTMPASDPSVTSSAEDTAPSADGGSPADRQPPALTSAPKDSERETTTDVLTNQSTSDGGASANARADGKNEEEDDDEVEIVNVPYVRTIEDLYNLIQTQSKAIAKLYMTVSSLYELIDHMPANQVARSHSDKRRVKGAEHAIKKKHSSHRK